MEFKSLHASFLGFTHAVYCMYRTIVFAGFNSFVCDEGPPSRLQCHAHRITICSSVRGLVGWPGRMTPLKSLGTFPPSQQHANLHLLPIRSAVTCFVSRSFGELYFRNDIILLICLI